jgi:NADPH:quinone reductase-like Zn-dependent oxidoreductase
MKEMTAHHFATGFYAVKPGDVALVNAATGGVGLTQMIKLLGGRVFARVSTEADAQIARAAGADHVIVESTACSLITGRLSEAQSRSTSPPCVESACQLINRSS